MRLGAHLRQKAGLFSQTVSDLRLAGRHQGKRASLEGRNGSYTLTQEASERHCGRTRVLSRKMMGRMKRLEGSLSNEEGMRWISRAKSPLTQMSMSNMRKWLVRTA